MLCSVKNFVLSQKFTEIDIFIANAKRKDIAFKIRMEDLAFKGGAFSGVGKGREGGRLVLSSEGILRFKINQLEILS